MPPALMMLFRLFRYAAAADYVTPMPLFIGYAII